MKGVLRMINKIRNIHYLHNIKMGSTKITLRCVSVSVRFAPVGSWNKKVFLLEHKRHTARHVASTPPVVLIRGGVPHPRSRSRQGVPHPRSRSRWGVPHPRSRWGRVPYTRSRSRQGVPHPRSRQGGTPSQVQMGYPGRGIPHPSGPGPGWGTLPLMLLNGGQTENITFRHPSDADGKNDVISPQKTA